MSEETKTNETKTEAAPQRANPGKMTTRIGSWNEDKTVFTVKAPAIIGATPKAIKDAIAALGYGVYDIMTGRDDQITYRKVERDSFG